MSSSTLRSSTADGDVQGGGTRPALPRGVRPLLVLSLAAAAGILVFETNKQWFHLDEWDFLAYRGLHLTGTSGIFYPHNEHWTTIPILIWRGLFNLVGVRHYWLYAVPMIAAHLVVATLLWRLMLRHHVDPWVATLLIAAFAVLGVGSGNLVRAFQLTFVGAVAFGLLAIDAIERDKRWPPPLWGICALMCSNIGIPMVVAGVLVAIVRRRYAAAVMAGGIPAGVFLVWYVSVGHVGTSPGSDVASLSFGGMASYVWTGLTTSMGGLFDGSKILGAVLVVVLALTAAVRRNVPAVLALTAVVLYVFVGLGRLQYGAEQAATSRYSYIAVALCLPLMGQLVTWLVRLRGARLVVMAGLVALVVVNVALLNTSANSVAASGTVWGDQIQAAAYLIHSGDRFPGQVTTNSTLGPPDQPSTAALASLIRHGQLPVPTRVASGELRAERARLGVFISRKPGYPGVIRVTPPAATTCLTIGRKAAVRVASTDPGAMRFSILHPRTSTTFMVAFPNTASTRGTSVVIPVIRKQHWLNIPFGTYPDALIIPSTATRLCEASPPPGG